MCIIPRFWWFCSLEEDGIFSRMYHKTWHIGSTFFQYPPYSENVGYWEYCFSISPLFAKNVGYWEYCFPISPLFRKCGILGNSTPNMPQFVNSMEDGKQSKPGYNVKISPFSSGSLGNKQSSGLQNCPRTSTAAQSSVLGQFCRPLDCIFPRIPRKKVESWPNRVHLSGILCCIN